MVIPTGLKSDSIVLRQQASENLMTVAVVIPTFNHACFLGDAISSVLAQTRPADEVIVVDDGSVDDPAAVVANFPGVRLIRQENRGLSAARNIGLRNCGTSHVVFLDADDRLLPIALEAGLDHAAKRPDCAFVYGAYYEVFQDWSSRGLEEFGKGDAHLELLQGNLTHLELLHSNAIGLPATVLYRRECLIEEGGFDETLSACEDYDLYLRMARRYSIANYPAIVAEYRKHGQNMSSDHMMMLRQVLLVLARHERRIHPSMSERAALRKGRRHYREFYASKMLDTAGVRWGSPDSIRFLAQAITSSPRTVVRRALSGCKRSLRMLWRRVSRLS
jgi:hypothetical protein